jgi:hypothetical protein
MHRVFLIIGLLTVVLPAGLAAQSDRDVVMRQLDAVRDKNSSDGWHVALGTLGGGTVIGQLSNAGTVVLELDLNGGRQTLIPAGCDKDCSDLDLRLYTGDGNTLITEDVGDNDVPVVTFTPSETGRYLLLISMPKCSTPVCWFGFRVFEK